MVHLSRSVEAAGIASRPVSGRVRGTGSRYGLARTRSNLAVVSLVVVAVFLERFERLDGASYPLLPIPDIVFLAAVGIFAGKVGLDLFRGEATLKPPGRKDIALCSFVALLGILSLLAVVTQPSDVTSGVQVVKTFTHLVVLLGAALLLGHALSHDLVAHAMSVYFAGAVVVAALAIVQAVDQNLVSLGVSDALHLVSRAGADGFVRPCSIFSEPAYLGYASLGGLVIGLSLVNETRPVAAILGCGICVAGLLLAAAAGPIAVVAPLGVYALVVRRRLFPRRAAVTAAASVLVGATLWFLTPVSNTIIYRAQDVSGGRDASAELRTELNRGSIDVWKTAPVTGVGLGNSRSNLDQIDLSWAPPGASVTFNSANAYLNLLGEAGPVAVGALAALLLALWWRSRSAPPRLDELTRVFIVLLALQFFLINPLIMPPVWFWAAQRLALQDE
jgi:O-Antigen ligase